MNKTIIFLLFFILSNIINGQELKVDFVNQNESLNPSNTHTLVFKVSNLSANELDLTPSVLIPTDWILSTKLSNIKLSANETKIVLITIQVPIQVSKGIYNLNLSFSNQERQKLFLKDFDLKVNQVKKISLKSISISDFIKAGDTIKGTFILKNEGNETETVFIEPSNGTFLLNENPQQLAPGKAVVLNTFQPTDLNLPKFSVNITRLNAFTDDKQIQDLHVTERTEVIPMFQIKEDIWLRFPIKVSGTFLGMQRLNSYESGFQGEIHGRGSLNEEGTNLLEFRAVGPNRLGLTTFSQYEEYFVNFENKKLYVHLGDKAFSSSLLTDFFRFGRGIEVRKKINKFEIGAFYNKPRFSQNISNEVNIYSKFQLNGSSHLKMGYLLKQDKVQNQSHLYFVSGKGKLFKSLDFEGEYALSNSNNSKGNAFHLQASTYFSDLSINMSYVYASPNFSGYYNNSQFFTANANYQISPKINLSVNYQKDAKNFERDTLYGIAPYRENMQFGLRYNYVQNGAISLFSGTQKFEDRMQVKQFFYNEKFLRIELFQELNQFVFGFQTYFAETLNFLNYQTGNSSLYSANFGYKTNRLSFNVNGAYSILNRYETANEKMFLFGGRLHAFIANKWEGSLFYQNTFYLEDIYADRNMFEAMLRHKISNKQEVHLIARSALTRNQNQYTDFSFSVRYLLNINAPIKKIKEFGILEGSISKLGNEKLEGIKLQLGPYSAITDAKGYFIFKDVNPDIYFLEIDQNTLDFNDIAEVSLPAKVEILEGSNYFTFGITKAAKVKGSIVLNSNDKNTEQDQSIIIELSSEKETFRKICDITKPFDFTYLKPGEWDLKIYRNGLHNKYQIVTENLSFSLIPNEEKDIEIKINKKEKEIQFLQQSIKVGLSNSKK